MQDYPSRPSQKSYRNVRSYAENLRKAQELVEDTIIANGNATAAQVASLVYQQAPELADSLKRPLAEILYARLARAYRKKLKKTSQSQFLLPGFERLDIKIQDHRGDTVNLLDANYYAVRTYYWSLMKKHTERKRADPKIKQAKALLEKMQKHADQEPGITVRQVLLLER